MDLLESVLERKEASKNPFAVIDLDNSIIRHDSAEAVLAFMAKHDIGHARSDFPKYYSLLDRGDMEGAYRFGAKTLRNLTTQRVNAAVRQALIEEGTVISTTTLFGRTIAKGINLRESVVALMRQLRAHSIAVWIVSASPEIVVRGVVEYFNLEVDGVIGVRNIVYGGIVTSDLLEPLSIFDGKVSCIKEIISPSVRPILALGDSMNDLPMLEYAELRVVVDRGNALAEKAKAEGWFILKS
ncbi:MAG TPA: HAD-IB family phosphatase [Candidatus Paceibacterota bacterium]|nr:HAD-IB family phosphatase [Candidatus Paceibacterota bacterium]